MGGVVALTRVGNARPSKLPEPARSIGEELGLLFMQERALTHQLAETRRAIYAARQRYAAENNLLMLPSYDTLRKLYS